MAHLPELFKYVDEHQELYIERLAQWVAVQSVSAWPEKRGEIKKMMEMAAKDIEKLGGTVELVDIGKQKLHDILSEPDGNKFAFPNANFTAVGNQIIADVMYVYKEGDVNLPSAFLRDVLGLLTTTVAPTTTTSTTLLPTLLLTTPFSTTSYGGFPGWALAIIIPCGLAIILVPLWILLCCMMCGGCAALKRRWHRRRSYNVQYTTRNGLF